MLIEKPLIVDACIHIESHELRAEPSAVERKVGILAPRRRCHACNLVCDRIPLVLGPIDKVLLRACVCHFRTIVIGCRNTEIKTFRNERHVLSQSDISIKVSVEVDVVSLGYRIGERVGKHAVCIPSTVIGHHREGKSRSRVHRIQICTIIRCLVLSKLTHHTDLKEGRRSDVSLNVRTNLQVVHLHL